MTIHLATMLSAQNPSTRLRAALAAGTTPDPALATLLIERCAIEPDFFVRDMLTWALIRLPTDVVLPLLHSELKAERAQARSQALHTLSKIGDPSTWQELTATHLHDADVEVARAAWRTAIAVVPNKDRPGLVGELVKELGRGDLQVQRSLSRALVELAEQSKGVIDKQVEHPDPAVADHARATLALLAEEEEGF